ncbi:MAG: purine-nucleoside phosphorylase [Clostridiales bacterium]|nr:purine-nucleoside phosphorylase [Clostridiales bacterium]
MNYPTPHINAKPSDFAKTVLMPGDPKRAKFVAENFLEDAVLINDVRGVQGYTGFYKGKKVSVMASGMGMASMGIYSYELFNFFQVENIIRIGSAGAMKENIKVRDIVLAMGASSDSNFHKQYKLNGTIAPLCSYSLLEKAVSKAKEVNLTYHVGNILSTDIFYNENPTTEEWANMGVLAVEMESAALYLNAQKANKNALTICTISDHLINGESLKAEDRQNSFKEMMLLALETAIEL